MSSSTEAMCILPPAPISCSLADSLKMPYARVV